MKERHPDLPLYPLLGKKRVTRALLSRDEPLGCTIADTRCYALLLALPRLRCFVSVDMADGLPEEATFTLSSVVFPERANGERHRVVDLQPPSGIPHARSSSPVKEASFVQETSKASSILDTTRRYNART